MITPVSPLFAILMLGIAVCTAFLLEKKMRIYDGKGRNQTIDGLRGFLAFFVFIHHSAVWYQFIHSDNWTYPPSRLFDHLGGTSVAFFFMITSFLFINKILQDRSQVFNWNKLFVSRVFRLVPLYSLCIFIMILFIMIDTDYVMTPPLINFIIRCGKWFLFGIHGFPNINNYENTFYVMSGVVWSLPWEWFFYFSLPIFFIFFRRKLPNLFILLISVIICSWYIKTIGIFYFTYFLAGMIAPIILNKFPHLKLDQTVFFDYNRYLLIIVS